MAQDWVVNSEPCLERTEAVADPVTGPGEGGGPTALSRAHAT